MRKATDVMAILCSNTNRQIKDDAYPVRINVTLDKAYNIMQVSQRHLPAGFYIPIQYTKHTCSASTEVFDLAGIIFPKPSSMTIGNAELDKWCRML